MNKNISNIKNVTGYVKKKKNLNAVDWLLNTLNIKWAQEAVLTKLRNDRDSKSLVKNGETFVEKLK